MRIVMFYHSLLSDWNHGNAHFLRGVATELLRRGHDLCIYEPAHAWSLQHLITEQGEGPIQRCHTWYAANRDVHMMPPARIELYSSVPQLKDRFADDVRHANHQRLLARVRDAVYARPGNPCR